ncbi:MAG TPA: sugar phosphate nucleotidyltransferase, partial [Longimicrobiales bacterium]|nr:sugar phosphate nucleotidyltransferase [Longimicrobiales bacterium]
DGVELEHAQSIAADHGLKGLVPFEGQPFLAYVLTALADAGYTDVCLVTRPEADPVREYFVRAPAKRLRIRFAFQAMPKGSADAVAAAEEFTAGEPFAVINSDNYYPADALRALHGLSGSGLGGFRRAGLLKGNVDAERLAGYALIESDDDGVLTDIIEKPDDATLAAADARALISMTCWRFSPQIFSAIGDTPPSARGELELPDAVRIAMKSEPFSVVPLDLPVLDLSRREDIPAVGAFLSGCAVDL